MIVYLQNISNLLLAFAYSFFPVFLIATKKKAKKMAFQRRPYIKISSKAKVSNHYWQLATILQAL
jgi:uncharacterized protein YoxC